MLVYLIGTAFVAFVLNWWVNKTFCYWEKRGVPSPPTIPWLGNVAASITFKKNLGAIYSDIYNKYRDYLYVGFYQVQHPAIIIRDPDLIKSILIKDFASFHDNDVLVDVNADPIFGRNPFVLKGHQWKVIRGYLTGGITTGKIKNMFNLIVNVNKNLVNYLNNEPETTGKDGLEAKELSAKFTTDVVASCAFGLEGNSFTNPDSEFRKMGKKLFSTDLLTRIKMLIIFLVPKLSLFLKLKFVTDEVSNWFIGILKETIKYREKNNIVRNDYLDLMLSLRNKQEFTEIDVMAQAMTFYGDGFETSSIALSFMLYELARNPEIQLKAQEEVDTVLKKFNGDLTYECMQEMSYLDKVIAESLRKHPPALFLRKLCTKPFLFPSPKGKGEGPDVLIETGMTAIIPVYAIHHDAQYYPDPDKFDPERFSDEAKNARPKCAYLPFGEGPRMCLGFRFALTQIKAALVTILQNFNLKENEKTKPNFEMDPMNFLLSKKDGIWINFYKRIKA